MISHQHSLLHMTAVKNSLLLRMNSLPEMKLERPKEMEDCEWKTDSRTAEQKKNSHQIRASSVKTTKIKHKVNQI